MGGEWNTWRKPCEATAQYAKPPCRPLPSSVPVKWTLMIIIISHLCSVPTLTQSFSTISNPFLIWTEETVSQTIWMLVCTWRELNYRHLGNILFSKIEASDCMLVFLFTQSTACSSLWFYFVFCRISKYPAVLNLTKWSWLHSGCKVQVETAVVRVLAAASWGMRMMRTVSDEIFLSSRGFIPVWVSHV